MIKPYNQIIIEESYIQIARSYGYCIHYDEISKMLCIITVFEVDSHSENDQIDQKLEVKMLFGFLDDKYKVYFLLPNNVDKKTYKAHYISCHNTKTFATSESQSTLDNTTMLPKKLNRSTGEYDNNYYDYKGQVVRESIQGFNKKVYEKWFNEIKNIVDFINQEIGNNLSVESKDFGIVLYCESVTNPNYAIIYLSLESKVVKIDKNSFNSFIPKEGQIFIVTKEVRYNISNSSVALIESRVLFLNQILNECADLRLFFDKYKFCYKYPTTDPNLIDLNSLEEGYYLIGFTRAKIYRDGDKLKKFLKGKNNKFEFVIDSIENAANIGKYYVGKSLVRIRKNGNEGGVDFNVIKAFGRVYTKEQCEKINKIKNKMKNHQERNGYSYENDILEEEFFEKYYNLSAEEVENFINSDEQFNAELEDDIALLIEHETASDFSSDMKGYFTEDDDDEYEKDNYYGSEISDDLDLREHYNSRNLEFELLQNLSCSNDYYDPWEEQDREFELEFSKWINKKHGNSIYDGIDITDERFYLSFTKKRYNSKTIHPNDKMFLVSLYDEHLLKEINDKKSGEVNRLKLPQRKSRA